MMYEPEKLTPKNSTTSQNDSYFPKSIEIKKEMLEEKKIRGPVLAAAMFFYTPAFSQRGTSTIPPPMLTAPPIRPAIKPLNMPSLIFSSDIFSEESSYM